MNPRRRSRRSSRRVPERHSTTFIGAAIRIDFVPDAIQKAEGPTSGRVGTGEVMFDPLLKLKIQVLGGTTLEALADAQARSLRRVRKMTKRSRQRTLASSIVENSRDP